MSRYVIAAAVLLVSLAAAYPQPYEAWSLPNVPLSALENLAASNDTVYFGGADAVYAYNVMDGAPLHKIKYGANGPYSVLAAGPHGWLYVAVNSSAYGYQNGVMKWNTTTVRNTQGSVVTLSPDFTKIAMVFRDAHVMVFNALTGTVIFRYDADNAGGTTPVGAVFGGRAVVVSGGGGDMVAFDSATGHGIWRYSTGLSEIPCSLGVTEDGLYAVVVGNVASTEFTLLVINIETAVVNATQQTRVTDANANAVWSVAVAPIPYNRAIVSTGSNVYAFDIPSMKLRWIRAVSSPEPAVPAGVHALMVVNNYVWGVDLDTGALNFAVAHATSIPEDQVKSYTGAMLAVAHSNLVPFVATSCDVTLVNGSSMQFRAVYRVPNYAVMTETQYSNDNAAPCQGASTNVVRPAVCTEDDVTQAVSSTKTWHRYYCFHNKRDVMSVKFRRYVGTSCSSAPAGGNVVYETVQYLNECVIERNFTSSELLSCVEAPY